MLNIVVELEKGNLNPLIDSFGFHRQNLFIPKEMSDAAVTQIMKELVRLNREQLPEVQLAASKGSRILFFNIKDILYIEAFGNVQRINGTQEKFEFYGTLCNIEKIVSPFGFLRIHHSYIISQEYIVSATSRSVKMMDGKEINVGRKYLQKYREMLRTLGIYRLN